MIFALAFIGLYFGVTKIHKKPFEKLIAVKEINYSKILWGFSVWFLLGIILEVVMYFMAPDNFEFTFDLKRFIPLLLVAIFLLPIQTSLEEILFRGYFLQGIALLAKNRWVPLLITSALFGLIHLGNPEIGKYGVAVMQSYYITAGLVLGIMTIMDDGLELALGVHAAVNIYGTLILSYEGSAIQTDTIMRSGEMNPYMMLVALIIMSVIFLFLASKKYKWGSWNKLTSEIHLQDNYEV